MRSFHLPKHWDPCCSLARMTTHSICSKPRWMTMPTSGSRTDMLKNWELGDLELSNVTYGTWCCCCIYYKLFCFLVAISCVFFFWFVPCASMCFWVLRMCPLRPCYVILFPDTKYKARFVEKREPTDAVEMQVFTYKPFSSGSGWGYNNVLDQLLLLIYRSG